MNSISIPESKDEYFPSGNRYIPPNANAEKADVPNSNNYKPVQDSKYDLSKANHPIVCVFTFLFKGLSIFRLLSIKIKLFLS